MTIRILSVAVAGLLVAACETTPKQTVLDLDTTDSRWASRECVAARKAVAQYKDKGGVRTAAGVAGLAAGMPVAGAAAALALNAAQDDEREDLNNQVKAACISDPLNGKGG